MNYNTDPLAFFQNTSVFSYPSYSFIIFIILVKIVLLLVAVAYFTIAERKCMAATQRRKGPNVVGSYGLLQPLADGLKLLLKDLLIPTSSSKSIFLLAPVAILTLSFISWSLIPFFLESIEVMYCMENSEIPTGESCEKTPQEKVKSKNLTDSYKDKWNSLSQNEKNGIIGLLGFLNFAGGIYVIAQYYDISWDDVAKFLTVLGIIPSNGNGPREPQSLAPSVLQDNDGKVVDKTQYPIFPPLTDVPTSLKEQLLFYLISAPFLLTFYYVYLQLPFLFIPLNILYLIGAVTLHYTKTKNYINFFLIKINFIWTNKEYILRSWTWLEKIRFVSTIKDIFIFHFLFANKYYQPIFFGLHSVYFVEIYKNPFFVPEMAGYNLWFSYSICIVCWTSGFALLFLFNAKIAAKFREKFLCVVTKNLAYAILGNPGGNIQKLISKAGGAALAAVTTWATITTNTWLEGKKQNDALRIQKQAETEELRIWKEAQNDAWKARNEGYRIHLEHKQDPRTFVEEPFEEFTKRKPRGFRCVIEETYSIFDFFSCLSSLPDLRYFTYLFIIFRPVIFDRFNWLIVFGYANMFKRSLVCSVKTAIKKISFIVSSKRDLLFDIILAISYVSFSVILFWSKPMEVVYSLSEFSTAIKAVPVLSNSVLLQRSYPFVSFVPYTLMNILALSSLSVYGIIISGWASNSKYAFLGSLRSAAQMISYEVSIGLVLLPVVLLSFNLNLSLIVLTQFQKGLFAVPLLPCAIIFFVSMLAEAELVAGYNIEYAAIVFAMFFLGEYSNMLFMSTLNTLLFFGGWNSALSLIQPEIVHVLLLSIKISVFCFLFILVRATLPRYKYNQLMQIGWKVFLPISLSYLMLVSFFVKM